MFWRACFLSWLKQLKVLGFWARVSWNNQNNSIFCMHSWNRWMRGTLLLTTEISKLSIKTCVSLDMNMMSCADMLCIPTRPQPLAACLIFREVCECAWQGGKGGDERGSYWLSTMSWALLPQHPLLSACLGFLENVSRVGLFCHHLSQCYD